MFHFSRGLYAIPRIVCIMFLGLQRAHMKEERHETSSVYGSSLLFLLPFHLLHHRHISINQNTTGLFTKMIKPKKIWIANHMKRPHHAHHWGTNDHQTAREYSAACFHLCFPLRCFCAGNVHLQLFFFREGHPASILHPCGASPFRLPHAHSLPFILPPPWGSNETGRQQLFSQHPGPFHTTGITPSSHFIKVTPTYLYSCPTLAPLDLLSHTHLPWLHTHVHTNAGWEKLSCGNAGSWIAVVSKADVAQQWA